jgi:ABC-type molybdate transport system substrate-binding protein
MVSTLSLNCSGCKQKSPSVAQIPTQYITIFAPQEMEPIIRAAEAVARTQEKGWRIELVSTGAQTLAWNIESGDLPDLYIASTIEMAEDLIPRPRSTTPWLNDHLVVITRADDPNPILSGERALERTTGPIAIGGSGTQLGDYARLAMRYAEIWPLVERRTTQHSSPAFIISSLRDGEVDHAILFASDVVTPGHDLLTVQRLDLPERARIIYTQAIFSDLGAEFADLLMMPEPIDQAIEAGFDPVITGPDTGD